MKRPYTALAAVPQKNKDASILPARRGSVKLRFLVAMRAPECRAQDKT